MLFEVMYQLKHETRNELRSGIAISSFGQCVDELVLNSIDARASCIAVRVDIGQGKLQVVDNGMGIAPCDMMSIGKR